MIRKSRLIVAISLLFSGVLVANADELSVASWGGAYQYAQSTALFQPAAKTMGITVHEETYGGMSDVKLKVNSGATVWDVVASGSGGCAAAAAEGILEELDYTVIDVSDFYPGLWMDHCVGGDVFSTVMAYNTETYGDNGPQNWADFWDVEKFPGKRAYRAKVDGALEPAIIADGVPLDQVYEVLSSEEGIERALNKIRELKPHIAVFWTSGAQHAQLMKDGEVDMTTGWNGRFDVAAKDGAKVSYNFNQSLLDYDAYGIPKGAPNKDLAMQFLNEISKPQYQAEFVKYITYGPTNKKAYDLGTIDEALSRALPSHPDNVKTQLPVNIEWYSKWKPIAAEMYAEMLTE